MRQQIKLTQQLVMTPQLQLAIKLLQMTRLELQDVVRQELDENPLLEEATEAEDVHEAEPLEVDEKEVEPEIQRDEFHEVEAGEETLRDWDSYLDGYNYSSGEQYSGEDERPSFENLLTRKGTLIDHLLWQLHMGHFSVDEVRIGEEIIGNIDESGYLRASIPEIAVTCTVDEETVLSVLERIQEFDPTGVAARDLRECLLIQARFIDMDGSVVERILQNHLNELETRKYKQIAKALGVDISQVLLAASIISGFDPRPGRIYGTEEVQYISADIFVYKVGDEYLVMLNEEGLPSLRLNPLYAEVRGKGAMDSRAVEYVSEKTRSAQAERVFSTRRGN